MSFVVKHEQFEGPLDLLLSLIEKRKLFINDISLAKVTDDYINHISQFEKRPLNESAHFILVASTLLLIKSRSLLPTLTLTEDEEKDILDLETRLKIYQTIKEASVHVKALFGQKMLFAPSQAKKRDPIFSPDASMTLTNISEAMKTIIANLPKTEAQVPKAIIRKVISLEEMMDTLTTRITSNLKMSFKDFSRSHQAEKVNVIVAFLAVLELVKQGMVHVNQHEEFGDIHMETKEIGIPRYNN